MRMQADELKVRLQSAYPSAHVLIQDLTGSGNHFEVEIFEVSFAELSRMERHQAVMSVFNAELKSGELHALSIKADFRKS